MANLNEVFWKREKVIVPFSFTPRNIVGCDEKNVFEFEAFARMGGKNLDGARGILIWTSVYKRSIGVFIIVEKEFLLRAS